MDPDTAGQVVGLNAILLCRTHQKRDDLTCRLNAKTATASSGRGSKLSKPMLRSHSSSTSPTAQWPAKAVMIQGRARCRGGHPSPLKCCATSPSLSYTPILDPCWCFWHYQGCTSSCTRQGIKINNKVMADFDVRYIDEDDQLH